MNKRIVSLLLVLVMVFGMLPLSAFAAERDEAKDQVHVIVENTTFTPETAESLGATWNDTYWYGTLVDTWVDLSAEATAMSCIGAALAQQGYTAEGLDSGYISAINGLAAFDGGSMSGWMGTLNDWFTDNAFDYYTVADGTLENGDEIRVMYTSYGYGEDLGCFWGSNDTSLKALTFSAGALTPAFDAAVTAYTLTVPADTEGVVITPTAANKNFQVHTKLGDTEYKRTATVPVTDGAVITIEVGGESIYTVTVKIAAPITADWPSFRGSDTNNGITAAQTPRAAEETELKWAVKHSTGWTDAPSPMIIADDALVSLYGNTIKKLDLQTGEVLASAAMTASTSWGSVPPTYGGGMIFCPLGGGTVQAFSADTLESVWVYTDALGGQAQSPITYADGKVYVGFGYGGEYAFVCLNAADGSTAWREVDAKGFYWAGAAVVGDYVIYGNDAAQLFSRDKQTGELVSELSVGAGAIRSSVCYADGKVYFTVNNAGLCRADFDAATGVLSELTVKDCSAYGSASTSTPTVYNGIVYLCVGNWSGNKNVIAVDTDTMDILWAVEEPAYPQCSVLLTTAYADTGYVYLYVTYNANPGGVNVIKAKVDGSEASQETLFDAAGYENYCICSVIADSDGTLYYKNDSGYVFALSMTEEAKDQLAAEEVIALIDTIGAPVTLESEAAIAAARAAYDALTDAQKALISNYDALLAAEEALSALQKEAADKAAAEEVIALIDAIGTPVTLESEAAIAAARAAYDALTDEQKALVTNYDVLTDAEKSLAYWKLPHADIESIYKTTGDALEALAQEHTPVVASIGGDWAVLGLARSGRAVPDGYYENVLSYVAENINDLQQLHSAKSTENSRVILALTSIGKDVTNVGGHNLLQGLSDMNYLKKQGINGPIWALIALDCGAYEIPAAPADGDQVTREKLIDFILSAQLEDGGWALSGETADPDLTAMAIQALAPYYAGDETVKAAVDTALLTLSALQHEDGGYGSWDTANAESCAQVIVALTAVGIDPHTDPRFVKNGRSVVDALCDYYVEGGGFRHVSDGALDGMATEQGYYALTAYDRYLKQQTRLYDMTDVTVEQPWVNPYTDVREGTWYYDAVKYTHQHGLMDGMGKNRFEPETATTRAMLVTVLYRAEGRPDVSAYENPFKDVGNSWYTDAIRWAAANGIINGVTPDEFAPNAPATREQMVTILFRYASYKGTVSDARADLSTFPDAQQVSQYARSAMEWAVAEGIIYGSGEGGKDYLLPRDTATRAAIATVLMRFMEG